MPQHLPTEVHALLEARDDVSRQAAWSRFLELHSRYILSACRYLSRDHDGAMDRYRYALEELSRDNYRRLRSYTADPRSKFSTWLVVVTQNLCRDFERKKYGRARPESGRLARDALDTRRRLVDLLAEQLDHNEPRQPDSTYDVERRIELDELRTVLRPALEAMPPENRLILKLRFDDDLPASQIVRVAQLPSEFHVYRRLNKILAELRVILSDRGFGP